MKLFSGWRRFLGYVIPLVLLPLPLYHKTQIAKCCYIIVLTVSYWIIEPVGVPVTALIPVFLFPVMGILDTSVACKAMMKDPVMNYMGCFAVGVAAEESGLPKRIALKSLLTIGTSIRRLTFGCLLVSLVLSMWLNNAAAAMAMVPIVETILQELRLESGDLEKCAPTLKDVKAIVDVPLMDKNGEHNDIHLADNVNARNQRSRIKRAMLLSITYGASLGGVATLNGSGPNFVFKGVMEEVFPEHDEPTYATWMFCHLPTVILCALLGSLFLQIVYLGLGFMKGRDLQTEKSLETALLKKYNQLGKFTFREGAVLFYIILLVCVWFFRDPKFMPGWSPKLPNITRVEDATPAIGVALLLFVTPTEISRFWSSPALLDWKTFQSKMPWGILLLVGSGFVMAEGTKKSGFSDFVSDCFLSLLHLSPGASVFVVCLFTSGLTEFLNNMVTTSMSLPILAQMAQRKGLNPLVLMIPATVGSSFAFMFPVSQPSNAIVFQRGRLRTVQMMLPGIAMNILCCCVEVFVFNTLGFYIFDLKSVPEWSGTTLETYKRFSNSSTELESLANSTFSSVL